MADYQVRLIKAIQQLAANPRPPGCKKLRGHQDAYRIKVGDYRIIYLLQDHLLVVLILMLDTERIFIDNSF